MTIVLPTTGSFNWDVPLDTALTDLQNQAVAAQTTANNANTSAGNKVSKDTLVFNVKDHGAFGDGVTDDTGAIQAAINAAFAITGSIAFLPAGVYVVSAPLTLPPQTALYGTRGSHIDSIGCSIKPSASFVGASVILMVDQTTGGYAKPSNEQRIKGITIDGSNLTGTTIDGIQAQGFVHGVEIEDVQIRTMPNHGIGIVTNGSGTPYSWRGTRIVASGCAGYGFNIGMTDSTWIDVEAIANGKSGFFIGSSANSHYTNCRAEYNTFDGFTLTGSTGSGAGSGGCTFTSCSTDRNQQNGFNISMTGPTPLIFTGLLLRRDGSSSTSSGYSGFKVGGGNTTPLIINGATCFVGTNDDGSGNATPQYGYSITGSSSNVVLSSGFFQGISAGINDDATNTWFRNPNVITATGTTSAQTISSTSNWNSTGTGTVSSLTVNTNLTVNGTANLNGAAIVSNNVSAALSITGTNTGQQLLSTTGADVTSRGLQTSVTGDTIARFVETVDGTLNWGPGGSGSRDSSLSRSGVASLSTNSQLTFSTVGKGLTLTEGTNAKMGLATLSAGTVTVPTTAVTANSRIFLTAQSTGAAPGALRVSTITAGTSFVITSTSNTDTSTVAWLIIEHA